GGALVDGPPGYPVHVGSVDHRVTCTATPGPRLRRYVGGGALHGRRGGGDHRAPPCQHRSAAPGNREPFHAASPKLSPPPSHSGRCRGGQRSEAAVALT